MSDKPTTTRCDGICARCDGAGTIPDWSAGRLPCPACKPMEGSEAMMAGAIRQSLASGEAIADVTQIRGLVRERNEFARQLAETRRIQPNDRYCPQCGVDTLRHAPDGTEYYGAHTQETCLEIRLARAQERANALQCDYDELLSEFDAQNHKLGQVIVENTQMRAALEDLANRAERARRVLQESGRREGLRPDQCGWGVLDTTAARAALANAPSNPYAAVVEAARSIVSRYAGSFFMDRNAPTAGATLIELSDLRVLADALAALGREDAPADLSAYTDGAILDEITRRGWQMVRISEQHAEQMRRGEADACDS